MSGSYKETFLAALSRFTNRHGLPSSIHSDNGKNLVGAARELTECYTLYCNLTISSRQVLIWLPFRGLNGIFHQLDHLILAVFELLSTLSDGRWPMS